MIRRDLIVELLISLYDKKITRVDFLLELHDATGMLRASSYQAASEVEKAQELAHCDDINGQQVAIKERLETALEMFDREFDLRKKKR